MRRSHRLALRGPLALGAAAVLGACGGGGGSDPAPRQTQPAANQPPQVLIAATTTTGFAPLSITFDAAATRDPDGSIASLVWDFGDGSPTATGVSVAHTYVDPGAYSVQLTATDDDGLAASAFATIRARGARLTGSIAILPTSAIDSDVNDRLTTDVPNDDFATAQPLPNPVRLGGYANLPGRGEPSGNLFTGGDASDFFAVSLAGNEVVRLDIGDAAADLDLRLWDGAGALVDASLGSGATETLEVAAPGDYFVEVNVFDGPSNLAGASNYVLSIGQDLAPTARAPDRLSDDFVPDEVLVRARNDTARAAIGGRHGLTERARAARIGRMQITDTLRTQAALRTLRGSVPAALRPKYATLLALKRLAHDPDVDFAEANVRVHGLRTPNDPFFGFQWHYGAINLPAAWDVTTGEALQDVIVAVIDTGILPQHPDLAGKLVPGYDFISDAGRARDGDGIDPNPTDAGDLAFGASSSFHGTHVAGTVAAGSDNGIGGSGVSWGARIMPLRALGVDGGTSFDVTQAIRFAAGLSNPSGTVPARRADIVNLSLGADFPSQSQQLAVDEARAAGVIVVASAGNESSSAPSYPAAYTGVVSVAATTIDDARAPYSNFGDSIDVAAPGGFNATDLNGDGIGDGVISTIGDDSNPGAVQIGYGTLSGTSMAAPHVAGVAALMKAVHPALGPEAFDLALAAGALTDDLGATGRDASFGHGRINAQKAVLAALALEAGGSIDPGPILAASNATLNFGVLTAELPVTLRNIGSGSVVIDSIVSSEPWLATGPIAVDADGLGEYRIAVDRTGLSTGAYAGTVTFVPLDPATNSVTVAVTVQVADVNPVADAGLHYVIAVDASGASVGNAAVVAVSNGSYTFALEDLPAGRYRIFAGTDMNDDGYLCDAAEACGAYRTLADPEFVDVDAHVVPEQGGIDFVSEFRAVFESTATSTAQAPSAAGGIRFDKPADTATRPEPIR